MEIKTQAVCLSAESKPYNFQGNSGTSHAIRFNVNGEIFLCKSTESQVAEYKQYVGEEGEATFKLTSPKENIKLSVVSFTSK